MRFPGVKILSLIGLALVLAAAWCWLLFPAPACPYAFEVEINSEVPTKARVSYDRGAGWRDSEAAAQAVNRVGQFTWIRLPLVPGKYKALRFAPTDRKTAVVFRNARLTTFDGRVVRRFSVKDFSVSSNPAVRADEHNSEIRVDLLPTIPAAALLLTFEPPLRLAFGFWPQVVLMAPRFAVVATMLFAALLLTRLAWERRRLIAKKINHCAQRYPRRSLAVCAVLATVVSSYPVVFFGKSFVSPTDVGPLLYDSNPALPEFDDPGSNDPHGADTGAMMWQHWPYTVQEGRALSHGELPLWNRTSSSGTTLLGQGQSMFGDPLQLLVIATGGSSWAVDLKFFLAKMLFACGLSWCVWALTRDFAASAILSLASAFIAFFNFRFNHTAIFSLSYAPWILVAWLQLTFASDRREFRFGLIGWFVANWMVITSGTVKEAYVLGVAINITGSLIFFLRPAPWSEKLRRAGFIGAGCITFLLASSPLWWTFLRALTTAYTAYEVPTVQQIRQEWFIGLFDDLFYREFTSEHKVYQPAANFLILLGCLCALQQPRRLWSNRSILAVLVVAIVSLGCAYQLGSSGWLATWMLKVPLLRSIYHVNNVFSCVAIVHLAVLAGWGFSAAREPLKDGRFWRLAGLSTGVIALLFVPYFSIDPPGWVGPHRWHGPDRTTPYQTVVYAHVLLLPAALIVLLWAAARRLGRKTFGAVGAMGVGFALVIVLGRHGFHLPVPAAKEFITTPGKRADLKASSPTVEFLRAQVREDPSRIIGTGSNFFPGFSSVYGFEGINGADAIQNRHYRELSEAADLLVSRGDWRYELSPTDLPVWRPVLDFLNVRYVVAPVEAVTSAESYQHATRLDFDVFRSERSWPRAFFSDRVEAYATATDLVEMIRQRAAGVPFVAIQKGDLAPNLPSPKREHGPTAVIAASDYSLTANETSFTVFASGPGLAVLHETWLKDDFRATLDGEPVPYFRVNHAFKAIFVPAAGTHRVTFRYWPRDLGVTLGLSVLGFILFIGVCIALRSRSEARSVSPVDPGVSSK